MRTNWRLLLTASLAVTLASSAGATGIVYSAGFENPPFNTGSIVGQDGWVAGSGTGGSQSIINTFARTGSQSLFWDNSSTNNSFYSVRRAFNGLSGAITPTTPLEISSWIYVDPATGVDRLYGVYATNSGTGTLGSTTLGITISGTGAVRAGKTWSSTYSAAPLYTNAQALVGRWAKVELTYNGVDGGAAVYDSNGILLWSTTFTAVTLGNANGTGTNSWNVNLGTDYNLTAARLGKGYHDDFLVRVVPEPAALLLLSLGVLALRRR